MRTSFLFVATVALLACADDQRGVPGELAEGGGPVATVGVGGSGGGAGVGGSSVTGAGGGGGDPWQPVETDWCTQSSVGLGWRGLDEATCFFTPSREHPTELFVFLHGMMPPDGSPKTMQAIVAEVAEERGAIALFPRGSAGLCSWDPSVEDWWCWPTSRTTVDEHAAEMIERWDDAAVQLESILSTTIERRYLLGFSNGGYFASYVGLEELWHTDGVGLVAAGRSFVDEALLSTHRPPFYVAVGELDVEQVKNSAQNLAYVLSSEGWKHEYELQSEKGHELWPSDLKAAWLLWTAP